VWVLKFHQKLCVYLPPHLSHVACNLQSPDLDESVDTFKTAHSLLNSSLFLLSSLSRSASKISVALIGIRVIFLPWYLKEYLLAIVSCTTLFSDIQGLPSNN